MRLVVLMTTAMALVACGETSDRSTSAAPQKTMAQAATPASVPSGGTSIQDYFTCMDNAGKTLVSAHRGGPAPGYPENAIETLKRTVNETGVTLLEIDIQTSKDGVLFLFHDDELQYETTGDGYVEEKNWSELRTLSLKDMTREPTAYRLSRFDEVLTWAEGRAILQLDIKQGTDYDDVALAVDAAGAGGRVMPIAYSRNQALALKRRFPNSVISVPIDSAKELRILQERGFDREQLLAWTGTEEVQTELNAMLDDGDVEVIFGTLGGGSSIDNDIRISGDEGRYADIANAGVDIIATDRPEAVKKVLVDAGKWPSPGQCQR